MDVKFKEDKNVVLSFVILVAPDGATATLLHRFGKLQAQVSADSDHEDELPGKHADE